MGTRWVDVEMDDFPSWYLASLCCKARCRQKQAGTFHWSICSLCNLCSSYWLKSVMSCELYMPIIDERYDQLGAEISRSYCICFLSCQAQTLTQIGSIHANNCQPIKLSALHLVLCSKQSCRLMSRLRILHVCNISLLPLQKILNLQDLSALWDCQRSLAT